MTAMTDLLHKNIVLVLNRNWQAIDTTTPAQAFCQMSTGAATGLNVEGRDIMVPCRWEDWISLPVRDDDAGIGTSSGQIRVPTVIVLSRFDRVPYKRPKFGARGIWERDGGRCQYTGRRLKPGEGNIDHVVPRSRGGEHSWENCVLAAKEVNHRKADKTPNEAGLKLKRKPYEPMAVPATLTLTNQHEIADWEPFLMKRA